jgi:hypothetical protein
MKNVSNLAPSKSGLWCFQTMAIKNDITNILEDEEALRYEEEIRYYGQ